MIKPKLIHARTAERGAATRTTHPPADSLSPVHGLQRLLAGHFDGQVELLNRAQFAREMGSEFVARVLEAGHRQLDQAPQTAAMIRNWIGDPAAAALAMRFNAALHLLARRGTPPALGALYANEHEDFDGAIGEALLLYDGFIAQAMKHPTQTNEVARAAAILAALMAVQRDVGQRPFELLELGSSCGLNLNLAHYAYILAGKAAGAPDSPVKIAPEWRGERPTMAPVEILSARGVDLHPLDPRDPATIERQLAYIWPDQHKRFQRLELALALAHGHPPRVERANALPWLAAQLSGPQADGVCRTIFHSMVLQYFAADDRRAVIDLIATAGTHATSARPLAWISFEWSPARDEVQLNLTSWPGGTSRCLATCHPYGAWIDWRREI
jgi:hypothetical protein